MTSLLSRTFRRQVLHPGDLFQRNVDADEVSGVEESVDGGGRVKTGARRIIHIDYELVFGEDVCNRNTEEDFYAEIKNKSPQPLLPKELPSPKYKEIIYGLTDESLKYFVQSRRRRHKRITTRVIKNLSEEFDKLADDGYDSIETDCEIGERKLLLQVPGSSFLSTDGINCLNDDNRFRPDRRFQDDPTNGHQQCLRRKPLFKTSNDIQPTKTGNTNSSPTSPCRIF